MLPKPSKAQAKIPNKNKSAPLKPAGKILAMYWSGTNTPFNKVSSLLVARIPSTSSQVFTISYPSDSLGINAWIIFGFFGSLSSKAWIPKKSHTGERLPNDFLPVNL